MYEPEPAHAPLRVTLAPEPLGRAYDPPPAARLHVDDILRRVVELGGSDLHLTAGCHPVIRLRGEMSPLTEYPVLDGNKIRELLYAVINQKQRERFEDDLELDTSHSIPGVGRFRVNVLVQRDSVGSVMRVIPHEIVPLGALGLPDTVLKKLYYANALKLMPTAPRAGFPK